jgi:beta-lactam-binding protein with PASTA domain
VKAPVLHSTTTRRLVTIGVAVVVVLGVSLGTFLAIRTNNPTPGAPRNETTSTVPNGTASTTTVARRVVPSVVGLTLRVAEVELQIVRFSYIVIFSCPAGRARPDLVMSQSPVAGMSAASGSRVRITTSPPNCP